MFTTEINSLENQIAEINAQLAKYRSVESEFKIVAQAITSLQESANALSPESGNYLRGELAKIVGGVSEKVEQAITPLPETAADHVPEEMQPPLEITEEINKIIRYESADEIEAALADEDEVDTHLMAIASILDSCPAGEIPGRVWFFVQNISSEFDDRILGYLPRNIRPEWDKQRTQQEQEARESIFPQQVEMPTNLVVRDLVEVPTGVIGHITDIRFNSQEGGRIATVSLPNNGVDDFNVDDLRYVGKFQEKPTPEFKVNDSVLTPTGETTVVTQVEDIGGRIYLEVRSPNGAKETYYHTDVKPVPVETVGEIAAPVAAVTAKKTRKPKAKPVTASEILQCKNWEEIRAIANNDPKLIKEAATAAHTKAEKELIENLPELIHDYMYETRDFSDLDWLPNYIKQRVRCLMSEPGAAA